MTPEQKTASSRLWWKLVRFGFRLLYHEMAFTYDSVANVVSLNQWWDWQRCALDFLPPPQDGHILELAHGTGRFFVDLHQRGYDVTGYDISPQMSRIASRRLRKHRIPVRLIRGRAQELPFPSGIFAAVVSTFPTPFIVEDETIAEVRRVLMSGRRLVFVPGGILTRGGAAKTILEGAYQVTGQRGPWNIDIEARFEKHGFHVVPHTIT
ncbi:MAG TPA: class I SAM-dependent methyltransferase, partial [Aggregatilineales bacterium]|nr:class I SAM-dependent methyltransferase [Aggregatilineales bacterium]